VRDHERIEASMARARTLMTTEFMKGVEDIVAKQPDILLKDILKDESFLKLFTNLETRDEDAKFLVDFIGENFAAKDLGTLSLRINVDGRYTTACGALDITYTDESAEEQIVRSKILRGETSFNPKEREVLKKIISEDYLNVFDYEKFIADLQKQRVPEDKIIAALAEKRELGLRDFADLSQEDRDQLREKLQDFYRLYEQAAKTNRAHEEFDVENTHIGLIAKEMIAKLPAAVEAAIL
jgi:hypothetical protein